MLTKYRIELKWAVIFTVMGLVWIWLEKSVGLHDRHLDKQMIYTNLVAIPAILIYVLALRDKKRNYYGGQMIYMEGFLCGIIVTLFVALLTPLSQYITSTYISPEYFENISRFSVEIGRLSEEQAAQNFNLKSYIVQATMGALTMGILTSAVVALFFRSPQRSKTA